MRSGGEPRGFSLILIPAGLCLLTALFLGASGADRPLSQHELLLLSATLFAGVAGTAAAARNSPHDALMFIVLAAFIGAIFLGVAPILGVQRHPVAAAAATACAVAFVAATLRLVSLRYARDPFPDLLAARFGDGKAVEMDDVQFVVEAPASPASAASHAQLRVWLQNTRDAVREVRIRLDLADKAILLAAPESAATLQPLEAGVLSIPLSARPSASGRTAANVWLVARGGGRRQRRRRVREVSPPTASWVKALGILASFHNPLHLLTALRGERAYGVGLELAAKAAPDATRLAPGEATWTSAWRESSLARAARQAGLGA